MSAATDTHISDVTLLGKCPTCGQKRRVDVQVQVTYSERLGQMHTSYALVTRGIQRDRFTGRYSACCDCKATIVLTPLRAGLHRTHKCGGRCTSAIGPSCDCECNGRNHGVDHKN